MTKISKSYIISFLITIIAISILIIYSIIPHYFYNYKDECIDEEQLEIIDSSDLKRQIWLDSLLLEDAKKYGIETLEEYFEKHDSLVRQSDGRENEHIEEDELDAC